MKAIFFTDLDGTLLDSQYSFKDSLEGIQLLKNSGIPLVAVSGRTFLQMRDLIIEMGIETIFVFENGCGIAEMLNGEWDLRLMAEGPSMKDIQFINSYFDSRFNSIPVYIENLPLVEICEITGLAVHDAESLLNRHVSVPFILRDIDSLDENILNSINSDIIKIGFHVTRGERFYHILPVNCEKGKAVEKVIEFYGSACTCELITGAVGDSLNDLSMLNIVDHAYAVRRYNDTWFTHSQDISRTKCIGPHGFNEAVVDFLKKIGK